VASSLALTPVRDIPLLGPGDDLAALIVKLTRSQGLQPQPGDLLVVAQKVISKIEGRQVALDTVSPGREARALAETTAKDPRLVELILSESNAVIRTRPGLLIVEHRCGHILANAGIDASNIDQQTESVLLWPVDPDASASRMATAMAEAFGFSIPVIINDSIGRAWRLGTVGHAIGVAGMDPLWNQVGSRDLLGNVLRVTEPATADGVAAAAALLQGEAAEGQPVVWVRGCPTGGGSPRTAAALLRPEASDMFR